MDLQPNTEIDLVLGKLSPIASLILLIWGETTAMQLSQMFAWWGAGFAGFLTAFYYGYLAYEKIKNRKHKYYDSN